MTEAQPSFPAASSAKAKYVPGMLLVGYKPGVAKANKATIHAAVGATLVNSFTLVDADVVRLAEKQDLAAAIKAYEARPEVAYAEPNYIVHADATPNDPSFSQLWGMLNTGQQGGVAGADIGATDAWDTSTGSSNVVVGVIDTGIDYTHPDLAANMWRNPGEHGGTPGVDDDANGIVDDIFGATWTKGDGTPLSGDPFDDNDHGTHCAGTIGGVGNNNVGVAGVNWTVRLMALKFLDADGSGSTGDAVSAIEYAVAQGATLTSNSWGGGDFSQTLSNAITAAGNAGQLFIAAAGNTSGNNNDLSPHYPSSYVQDNIIAVASVTRFDGLSGFSCFGAVSVDLAAPGSDILSTVPGAGYSSFNGTSMATPHVSGAAALLYAIMPGADAQEVKGWLLDGAVTIPALAGRVLTGGRLNVASSIQLATGGLPPVRDLVANSATGSSEVQLSWTNPAHADFQSVVIRRGTAGFPASPTDGVGVYSGAGTSHTDGPLTIGEQVSYRAWARSSTGEFSPGRQVSATVGGTNDECSNATILTTGVPVQGSNSEATGSDLTTCASNDFNDVWYRWTPGVNAEATVSLCSDASFDTTLAVFSSCGGSQIICNDDTCGLQSQVTFTASAGTEYLIRVAGYGGSAGTFTIVGTTSGGTPGNDDCANAAVLQTGVALSGSTIGATGSGASSCGVDDPLDVWYTWIAPSTGEASISLCNAATFDTTLAVFDSCGSAEIACNDQGCGDRSSLCLNVTGGETYLIRVAGRAGETGEFTIVAQMDCDAGEVPVNDDCQDALPLTINVPLAGTNVGATGSSVTSCGEGNDTEDVWYTWTATANGDVNVSTCTAFGLDTTLAVYESCGGAEIACNDQACGNQSQVCFSASAGVTYRIRVAGYEASEGLFTILVSEGCSGPAKPENDECADAIEIDANEQVDGTTFGATGSDLSSCASSDYNDVWYVWTPTNAGNALITTCAFANFDTTLSVFDACGGNQLACNDDSSCGTRSSIALSVAAETTYLIRVAGYAGFEGTFTLEASLETGDIPNDECDNAIPLVTGVLTNGSNEGAQGTDVSPCGFGDSRDVWYSWTAPASGDAQVTLCDFASFDTTLAVFDACAGTALNCNDDDCGLASQVCFTATGGSTYIIRVSGYNGAQGEFNIVAAMGCDGVLPPPVLSGISPSTGPATGGTSVMITGIGLSDVLAVSFGGTPAASFVVDSDTSITAETPAHAEGPVDVSVTSPLGTSNAVTFTYGAAEAAHPADTDGDGAIGLGEATAFAARFVNGDASITLGQATRFAAIFLEGGCYIQDLLDPIGWVPEACGP